MTPSFSFPPLRESPADGRSRSSYSDGIEPDVARHSSPLLVALVATGAALLFVLVRLWSVGDGDLGSFVGAGDLLSSESSLPLESGPGYDGQFYYRMASSPLDFDATSNGVTLDSEVRLQRIGYPAITWLVTAGGSIPVTLGLVTVNVIGMGLIAGIGATLLGLHRRSPWWGLALVTYFGFAFVIAKDLTEITEVTFLMLAVLAAHHHKWLLAALALCVVVLTRESAMFVVPTLALWRLWQITKRRVRPSQIDLTWVLPPMAFGLWQLVVRSGTGRFPLTAPYRHSSFNVPGWPFLSRLDDVFGDWSVTGVAHMVEVIVLLVVVAHACTLLRDSRVDPFVRALFIGLALACLSLDVLEGVWITRSLRMFSDVFVISLLILIITHRRLTFHLMATGLVSMASYGWFVTNL